MTADSNLIAPLYLGCPMWQHPDWRHQFPATLAVRKPGLMHYAQVFNSVEGNTSFYHLPDAATLEKWCAQVDDDFRFTFKFPQTVSHASELDVNSAVCQEALARFAPFAAHIGNLMLQLPARFGPTQLPRLQQFLATMPEALPLSVEVRHPDWFDKADNERVLNRLLMDHGVNRIMMDTRALFQAPVNFDPATAEAQSKKPRLPTHVIATAQAPIVRYVGHPDLAANQPFLLQWIGKIHQWRQAGLTPFVFLHMADNGRALELVKYFLSLYQQQHASHLLGKTTALLVKSTQQSLF